MSSNYVDLPVEGGGGSGVTSLNSQTGDLNLIAGSNVTITPGLGTLTIAASNGGGGTVTSVSVTSANGLAGTVTNPTTTPAISLSTTVTGVLKGNGTAISAATAGTDYVIPSGSITGTSGNITATSNSTLTTLSSLSLPGSQVTGNISGSAANITATSNSTLTTLSALSLPGSQVTGNISGTASNITATSNSTLTTLSALSLPGSQVSGNIAGNAANVTGTVAVANGGTGTTNGSITGTGALTFAAGGSSQNVTLTPSGSGYTVLNGNVGIGTTTPGASLDVQSGTITTNTPGVSIKQTWNNAATTFDAPLFMNITNTASAAGSLLADLQVGGASQVLVGKAGNIAVNGGSLSNWALVSVNGSNTGLGLAGGNVVLAQNSYYTAVASSTAGLGINLPSTRNNGDSWLSVPVAKSLRLGSASATVSPSSYILSIGEDGVGTNIAGGNATIRTGLGTGNAATPTLTFQAPTPGVSGATAQTYSTIADFNSTTASTWTFKSATNITGSVGINTASPSYKLDVNGPARAIHFIGGGSAPTLAAGTGAGTSPTVSIAGTDTAGTITVTTGTSPATNATIVTVTFATAYASGPYCLVTPANAATAALGSAAAFVSSSSTTTFLLTSNAVALAGSTTYVWYFCCVQ